MAKKKKGSGGKKGSGVGTGSDVKGIGKDRRPKGFAKAPEYKKTPYDIAARRADIRTNPGKYPDVAKRYSAMKNARLLKGTGAVLAVEGAAIGGYMAGDYINKKYNISSRLADAALRLQGKAGYEPKQPRSSWPQNAAYSGVDVDDQSYHKKVSKKKKK